MSNTDPARLVDVRAFLDAITDPAFMLDVDLKLVAANKALCRSLGRGLDELIGVEPFEVLPPDVATSRRLQFERAATTKKPVIFDDSNEGRHFTNSINPMLSDDGELTGFAVFALDITEYKKTEAALRESEGRYRRIFSATREGIWKINSDNVTVMVNEQMATMLGYEVGDLIGTTIFDFMDEEAKEIAAKRMSRRRDGISERLDFRFRHKDGRDVWAIVSATPLFDEDGEYAGAVAMITDDTERRALEQSVQQTQKLESLGVLAGGIAHDFNNILSGVLGNASLARTMVEPESPLCTPLEHIETSARRAAELTRQLLAYAGQGRYVIELISLNHLISEMSTLLSPALTQGATIDIELDHELAAVRGDATQLRQVLLNLITNACDSIGSRGGRVEVRTSMVEADESELASFCIDERLASGRYVSLKVSDDGCGMDADTQQRIFDPFFTTKFTGRGLGLASVLGILRSHHGGIRIDSSPGAGAVFEVLIPSYERKVESPRTKDGLRPGRGLGTVLVVDDEQIIREAAKAMLESQGFEVIEAAGGAEALELYRQHRSTISTVLLDQTMPGMSGRDVLLELRTLDDAVRVVLSSGFSEEATTTEDAGRRVQFLPKPYTLEELLEALEESSGD